MEDKESRRIFLLSRDEDDPAPSGFPAERFLTLTYPNTNSPFVGKIVPVIWELDAEGKLTEPFFGYNAEHFTRILALSVAPVGGPN